MEFIEDKTYPDNDLIRVFLPEKKCIYYVHLLCQHEDHKELSPSPPPPPSAQHSIDLPAAVLTRKTLRRGGGGKGDGKGDGKGWQGGLAFYQGK